MTSTAKSLVVPHGYCSGKSANKEDWQLSKKSRYTEGLYDINGDLVNFWKYIKNHPEAFVTEPEQLPDRQRDVR
jgi:hypothetical protein